MQKIASSGDQRLHDHTHCDGEWPHPYAQSIGPQARLVRRRAARRDMDE